MTPPSWRRPIRALTLLLPVAVLVPAVAVGAPSPSAEVAVPDGRSLFAPLPGLALRAGDAVVEPLAYTGWRMDPDRARAVLAAAGSTTPTTLSLPDPEGDLVDFTVTEQSVMAPALQAQFPEIRTYSGRALDGTGRSVSLGVTDLGFFASVRTPGAGESWYVDPATRGADPTSYVSYHGSAVPEADDVFVERGPLDTRAVLAAAPADAQRTAPGAEVSRRTYRMAFVTDPTYAARFGSAAGVMSAKAQLIARTNQIYNDDLAIRFELVAGTERLNLDTVARASGPHGPCGANACYSADVYQPTATAGDTPDGCTSALLTRTTFVLGQIIGADNYDIGHIGLGVNGGGIAGLGVVGGARKAQGCTGLPDPRGDFYAVDYFSHEVGHQMGGNHTFNGAQVNCSTTNRNGEIPLINPSTAVEPGSGSTVMAYAGICGQDNLQPHSDPYFSHASITEITDVVEADPSTVSETQTISLAGFDTDGDSFELTYPGSTATPQVLTRGSGYNVVALKQAVQALTGCIATVNGYDGASNPGDTGFTVQFSNTGVSAGVDCTGRNFARFGVVGRTGGVTGTTGVQTDGGPSTNRGTTVTRTGNRAPTVVAPADKTIPTRTPFTLTGSASDLDRDALTYLWEQADPGGATGTALVDGAKTEGPLFRVFGTYADVTDAAALTTPAAGINLATASPSRTFPDLAQVLSGNTNAKTGACPTAPAAPTPATSRSNVPVPTVECYAEFLPTAQYGAPAAGAPSTGASLTFRLTARDNATVGGGTQFDDVTLTVATGAGPLLVTSRPARGATATGGTTETVTWAVNGTSAASMAPQVRLLLSTDGGQSFPTVLAASTANDGSEVVTLPRVTTSRARLKVEAVGNYFFAVNDAPFSIATPGVPDESAPAIIPGAGGAAQARLATRTSIRLPQRSTTTQRRAVVRTGVSAARASGGAVGRLVVKVDGRTVRTRSTTVTTSRAAMRQVRLPRGLRPGTHRVRVVFKPARGTAYAPSRSRTVVLRVLTGR